MPYYGPSGYRGARAEATRRQFISQRREVVNSNIKLQPPPAPPKCEDK